jgi:hypothetical protein
MIFHGLALTLSLQLTAAAMDGNDLLRHCGGVSSAEELTCAAYISGVVDEITLNVATEAVAKSGGKIFRYRSCIPSGVTLDQIRDVIAVYLRNNPSTRHLSAASLAEHALADAFPCQEH